MKSKTKYLLLILSIVGLSLILFNEYKAYSDWSIVPELELSKGLFVIGIISFGLYFIIKKCKNYTCLGSIITSYVIYITKTKRI